MAVSEVNISGSFLSEVQWARETIRRISEAKIRDLALGLDPASHQPDALFSAFARRDLLFYPYIRSHGFSVGNADAYMANIATLHYYVERERREEQQSVRVKLQELAAARAQAANIGLLSPGGSFDEYVAFFALRELRIDPCYTGKVSVGELTAYDENIARLQAYLGRVDVASAR